MFYSVNYESGICFPSSPTSFPKYYVKSSKDAILSIAYITTTLKVLKTLVFIGLKAQPD